MHVILRALLLAMPLLQTAIPDRPRPQLTILVLNGVDGQPIPNVRLLVFAGATYEEVRDHRHSFDLQSDNHGIARLPPRPDVGRQLNIFVDFMTQCEVNPNQRVLSLRLAMEQGLVSENSCGSIKVQPTPDQLVVFARKPTFRERMAW